MPRNAEVDSPVDDPARDRERRAARASPIDELAARCDVTTRTIRPRSAGARRSRLPALRRQDERRWADALAGQRPGVQGPGCGTHRGRAVRALLQPHAASSRCRARRSATIVESAFDKLSGGADAAHAGSSSISCRASSRRKRIRCGGAATIRRQQQLIGPRARGDAPSASGEHHLLLEIERPDQDLSRPPVPARARAGRTVSARLCAGVRRGADVCDGTDSRDLAARGTLHAN